MRKPVLVVWGREDRITPFAQLEVAVAVMPAAEFLAVDKARPRGAVRAAGDV